MRKLVMVMLSFMMITGLSACDTNEINSPEVPQQTESSNDIDSDDDDSGKNMKLKIIVGLVTFTATLEDNAAANAFKKLLPMTVTMSELNNNEKYYDLQSSLPVNSSNPGMIQSGDLMLYGSRTLWGRVTAPC